MLRAVALTLWRGTHCLFDGLSFEVGAGAALLVRGANGSGKTTLLRVLCGLTRPESGHVEWTHEPAINNAAEFRRTAQLYRPSDGSEGGFDGGNQNLAFFSRLDARSGEPWKEHLEALNLSACADLEVRYLSAGQKRRVALARMLMSNAELWIMDEPFANLDSSGRHFLGGNITALMARGGSAIVAAHDDLDIETESKQTIHLGDTQ